MTKILVVIDMQNDFIDGSLGTKEAKLLVPKIVEKINEFDGKIFTTQDTHHADYLTTLEGIKLPVEHCVEGQWGWQLNDEVRKALSNNTTKVATTSIEKPTFGSFSLIDHVREYVKAGTVEEIELTGLCTGICVLSNAILLRAAFPNTKITVNSKCTECVTPNTKKTALDAMRLCQIDIMEE